MFRNARSERPCRPSSALFTYATTTSSYVGSRSVAVPKNQERPWSELPSAPLRSLFTQFAPRPLKRGFLGSLFYSKRKPR